MSFGKMSFDKKDKYFAIKLKNDQNKIKNLWLKCQAQISWCALARTKPHETMAGEVIAKYPNLTLSPRFVLNKAKNGDIYMKYTAH